MGNFISKNWFDIVVVVLNTLALFQSELFVDGEVVYSHWNLLNSFWVGVFITSLTYKFNKMFLND